MECDARSLGNHLLEVVCARLAEVNNQIASTVGGRDTKLRRIAITAEITGSGFVQIQLNLEHSAIIVRVHFTISKLSS